MGISTTCVKTVRGNLYCVQIDARSPHNTYTYARKETNQKINGRDFILSVRSEGGTLHLYGCFHSLMLEHICLATQAKQHKEDRCKHH
jgi:hypothetical protein